MQTLVAYLETTGRTQRWLAEQIGVREATVSAWCRNGIIPRPPQMKRIADVTEGEVPVTSWFEGAE